MGDRDRKADGEAEPGAVSEALEVAEPVSGYRPRSGDVEELILAAKSHSLGIEFLVHGELGSVAATFGTHAFTVDAARDRLTRRSD